MLRSNPLRRPRQRKIQRRPALATAAFGAAAASATIASICSFSALNRMPDSALLPQPAPLSATHREISLQPPLLTPQPLNAKRLRIEVLRPRRLARAHSSQRTNAASSAASEKS